MRLRLPLLSLFLLPLAAAEASPEPFALREGDRVAFLGDGLIEGEHHHGWIELMLTTRTADRNITFRNLGWNGDTLAGDSRFGLSLLQAGCAPARRARGGLPRRMNDRDPGLMRRERSSRRRFLLKSFPTHELGLPEGRLAVIEPQ